MQDFPNSIGHSTERLCGLLAALFSDTDCRVMLLTRDSVVVDLNEAACQFFEGTRERLLGARLADLYPQQIQDLFPSWPCQPTASPEEVVSDEYVFRGSRWVSKTRHISLDGGQEQILCVSRRLTSPIPARQLNAMIDRYGDRRIALGDLATLSEREFEVATLIGAFLSDGEIAQELHRSIRTVHAHRRGIGQKTGLRRRSEIAELIRSRGLAVAPSTNARGREGAIIRSAA